MGDFFKQFEKHLENVASVAVANAASALDEYPDQGGEQQQDAPRLSLAGFEKKAIEYWREANIEGKRAMWNEKRLEIEQAQRSDRGQPPTAQALRVRLTSAEGLLLTLLDLLAEAPDPVHELAEAAGNEAKIEQLKRTVERLSAEADQAAKGSSEVKELREKARGLEKSLGEANEALKSKSEELERVVAEQAAINVQELQARDVAQTAELATTQQRLKAMMAEHERTQSALFELTARSEEERAAQAAQNEMATAEVERAQQQVAELLRAREQLTQRLAGVADGAGEAESAQEAAHRDAALQSLQVAMAAKEHQLEQLKGHLASTTRELGQAQAEAAKRVEAARGAQEAAEARADALAQELSTRADPAQVEALRKQVSSLASLVDSSMEAEGWTDSEEGGSTAADKSTVQMWLQERNKKLADEVTSLKRRLAEAESASKERTRQLDGARAEAEERAQLVARLEADLEHASASGAQPVNPAEALAEVVGTAAAESAGPGSSAEDLLRIVAGQRDRYRAAQAKAEEELSGAQAALAKSAGALETAQADNVTLYEKIRYLESYSAQQLRQLAKLGGSVPPPVKVDDAGVPVRTPSAAAARYSCGPVSVSVGEDADDGGDAIGGRPGAGGLTRRGLRYQCFGVGDEEEGQPQQGTERYRREYEQRLNPFERFKHREAAAGIANLGASDRAVLAGGQLLAGSKMARAFVAVYAALLHAFVFFTLYVAAN
eukprot:jgi/Tetstr1/448876/TSEL_036102.t1